MNKSTAVSTSTGKITLVASAHNNDGVVLVGCDWQHGIKISGCLGFAIARIDAHGVREELETYMPFAGTDNKDWKAQKSSVWPIQHKYWLDFTGVYGSTYTYELQAMGGKPGALKPIDGLKVSTNAVTLTTKVDDTFECAFTRGILSTQALAHMIGLDKEGNPNFQMVIDALADYKKPNNPIRKMLVGSVPDLLLASVKNAAATGGHVYQALYELSSAQLVDFLADNLKSFSLILGNTGADDATNAPARKRLHELGAKITDRIIGSWGIPHNKFQVEVDKNGKPHIVTTGSTNWTDTGMGCQSNIAVRIHNDEVGANFLDYWNRLLADNSQQSTEFRARNAKGYSPIKLKDGTIIETWYQPSMPEKTKPKDGSLSPFLARVKGLMEGAKEVLVGEVFYPGNPSVVQWMADITDKRPDLYAFLTVSTSDALQGVKAKRRPGRPPVFTVASGREKQFADFIKELLKLPDAHAITHGKIIVIDPFGANPVVIFGSDNLGLKASCGNDENAIIVLGNHALAQYVFVNMFDINKHYLARAAAARAGKDSKFTGKLDVTDGWQDQWIDGFKALEAQLLATGKWDGSSLHDDPNLTSEYVVPFKPRGTTGDTKPGSASKGSTSSN
jgi:hypothetical protein